MMLVSLLLYVAQISLHENPRNKLKHDGLGGSAVILPCIIFLEHQSAVETEVEALTSWKNMAILHVHRKLVSMLKIVN